MIDRRPRLRLAFPLVLAAALLAGCGAVPAAKPKAPLASLAAVLRTPSQPTRVSLAPGAPLHLASLQFVNGQDGWAGGQGVVMATTDGGKAWKRQYVGKGDVRGFSFPAGGQGFAATSAGLLALQSGGAWHLVNPQPLAAVQFLSAQTGYGLSPKPGAAGPPFQSLQLLLTKDGGKTWQSVPGGPVQAACFFSTQEGIAVAGSVDPATEASSLTVRTTKDGGATWQTALTPGSGYPLQLTCTHDGGAFLVVAGGGGMTQQSYSVYRSGDFGSTWTPVLSRPTAGGGPAPGNPTGVAPGPGNAPGAIAATDRNHAVMLGVCWSCGYAGTITESRTSDGGRSWQTQPRPIPGAQPSPPLVLDMLTQEQGFLLTSPMSATPGPGAQSILLGTTDGGATWDTLLQYSPKTPAVAVRFTSPERGYGIGLPNDPTAVVRTTDGGRTWRKVGTLPAGTQVVGGGYDMLAAPRPGVLLFATQVSLLQSTDGGADWTPTLLPSVGYGVSSVDFSAGETGCVAVAVGDRTYRDYATTDGGKTWRKAALQGVPAAVCSVGLKDPALGHEAAQLIARLAPLPGGKGSSEPPYVLAAANAGGQSIWLAFMGQPRSRLYVLARGVKSAVHDWPSAQLNIVGMSPLSATRAMLWTTDGRILATRDAGAQWQQVQ